MTKMKSKKMTKSTFAIIIMAVAMVAMLAFGGTYAYFTATAIQEQATIKMGYVKLAADGETFSAGATNVMPGDTVLIGGVTLEVDTTSPNGDWVAIKVDIAGDKAQSLAIDTSKLDTDLWEQIGSTNVFISKAQVKTDIVAFADGFTIADVDDNWVENEASSELGLMNAQVTITIKSASVQGSVSAETAKTELAAILGLNTYPDVIA